MTAATQTRVEILRFEPQLPKTGQLLAGLIRAASDAGVDVVQRDTYRGGTELLVLYGPGAADRQAVMARHLAAGGHVACFDAPYWHRGHKLRVSMDAAHPQAWVLRKDWPRDRFVADQVRTAQTWKAGGPIIVAGLGLKARAQFGSAAIDDWEAEMIAAARQRWPSRRILYRRKPSGQPPPIPTGVGMASAAPIEQVLTGASLVITWHSNVAVDAIRLGIPVICRDGAAAAVSPSGFGPDDPRPLPVDVRDRFLGNLAWFQWGTDAVEARGCWRFLQELLS